MTNYNENPELKMKYQALLSFVGNHDPYNGEDRSHGPVLSLLNERQFERVYLIWTGADYFEKARMIEAEMQSSNPETRFFFLPFELESVINYEEIFVKLKKLTEEITDRAEASGAEFSVLLDPGTPQMQTVWLLLVKAGILNAKLLQGVPARFTGGRYMVREVDIDSRVLPEVTLVSDSDKQPEVQPAKQTQTEIPPTVIASENSVLKDVYSQASVSAEYDAPVLIEGDTGTGKEVLARFIYNNGPRKNKAFVAVNCATINASLADSTLFGHVKGAFTGALTDRPGYFKSADGGTIFLDEIGELPLEIQPKLLRALDYGEFQQVGTDKTVNVDVRVIAATNRNLEEMIDEGSFRADLYQRINVLKFNIPPLSDRREDIPLLLDFFISDWNRKYGKDRRLSAEALSLLTSYSWPRNVRQIKAVIERLCCITITDEISSEILPAEILEYFNRMAAHADLLVPIPEGGLDLKTLLNSIEARYYREAMERTGSNASEAARLLGIAPPAFRKALRERINIEE